METKLSTESLKALRKLVKIKGDRLVIDATAILLNAVDMYAEDTTSDFPLMNARITCERALKTYQLELALGTAE